MSKIINVSKFHSEKQDNFSNKHWSPRDYVLLSPFFLLFVGDFKVPVGDSIVTTPISMLLIIPAFLWCLITGKIILSKASLLLISILFTGFLGFLLTPLANFLRSLSGVLPIIFSILTIIVYQRYHISYEKAVRCIFIGGVGLAISVIFLFIISLGSAGDYYEQKLIIETPLGRSNYLAAFLLFLFALSRPKNSLLSAIFLIAIFCTLSRGGLVALLGFFVVIPFLKLKKLLILIFCTSFYFSLIAYLAFDNIVAFFVNNFEFSELNSVFNRFELWAYGFNIISDNTIFGIGPNTFRTLVELDGNIEDVWGVHNSILLIILNYGIFGLIFYSIYLIIIYKSIFYAEKKDDRFFYLRAVFLVLMFFSLYEPLVGSAAFELLLALLFVLARSKINTNSS